MPLPLNAFALVPQPAVTTVEAAEDEGPFVDDDEDEDEPPPPLLSRPLPIVPGPTRPLPLGTTSGGEFEAEFTSMGFVAPVAYAFRFIPT